jgi:hypothetical protein
MTVQEMQKLAGAAVRQITVEGIVPSLVPHSLIAHVVDYIRLASITVLEAHGMIAIPSTACSMKGW